MNIDDILNFSPPALVVAVCYIIGVMMTRSCIDNKWILPSVFIVGMIAYPILIAEWTAKNVLCGALFGSSSTWADQLLKQFVNGKTETNKNDINKNENKN